MIDVLTTMMSAFRRGYDQPKLTFVWSDEIKNSPHKYLANFTSLPRGQPFVWGSVEIRQKMKDPDAIMSIEPNQLLPVTVDWIEKLRGYPPVMVLKVQSLYMLYYRPGINGGEMVKVCSIMEHR